MNAFRPGDQVRALNPDDNSWRYAEILRYVGEGFYLVQWAAVRERFINFASRPPRQTATVHEDNIRRDGAKRTG